MTETPDSSPIRDRFRIRFAKTGLLRWIGHRDLQRLWERMLRRSGIRLSMTEGFHPKPRISFPSALALGVEGLDEVVEIELAESIPAPTLRQRLIDDQQPGLEIGEVRLVAQAANPNSPTDTATANPAPQPGKAKLHSSVLEVSIPPAFVAEVLALAEIDEAVDAAKRAGELTVERKGKTVSAEIATAIPVLQRRDHTLHLTLVDAAGATLKPTDVLEAIGLQRLIEYGGVIRRTRVILVDEIESRPPSYPVVTTDPTHNLPENPFKERI